MLALVYRIIEVLSVLVLELPIGTNFGKWVSLGSDWSTTCPLRKVSERLRQECSPCILIAQALLHGQKIVYGTHNKVIQKRTFWVCQMSG